MRNETLTEQQRMLIGEAKSAVGQCTAILGAERTNRIIAEIDSVLDDE